MLEILFRTIPKATNEIIFVLGVLGLFILCLFKKRNVYVHVVLCVALGMIIWRCAYRINSSRYASALIYPFSIFAALFLSYLARAKWKVVGIICFLIGVSLLISWGNKNYNVRQDNSNLNIIAELHNRFNSKEKEWTLITSSHDAGRIGRMDGQNNPIEIYSEKTTDDVRTYIGNHRSINKNVLFNVTMKRGESDIINLDSPLSRYKHILSIYSQKNKKKRENVYEIVSKAEIKTLSLTKGIPPESGILKNGDLEQIDSPEESYRKFKNHIGRYSLYYDIDESRRTPVNAYFYNASNITQYLPYYSCLNNKAVSGNNSARIITTEKGVGYLLFYQKFYSGTYWYSVVISGKRGTTVCIVYDLYADKKWSVKALANYTIPSKGVFQIKTSFSVPGLNPGEYFLVGAWVRGDAYLDNFCLNKTDE